MRILTYVVSVATIACGVVVTGCESEFQSTRQSDPPNSKGRAEQIVSRSNAGSLEQSRTDDPPLRPEDIIRPGDQVQVMVWGHPEFNTTTTVKSYGTITVPLVGDVIAQGITENQLAKELKQRLSDYIKGDIRVNISHVSMNNLVSVMGAVNKQGNYSALGQMSLVEIISDAGGATVNADLRHVKIFRQGSRQDVEEINLQRHFENGNLTDLPEVKPGDTVFVPSEENLVREIASYGQDLLVLFGFFAPLH